MIAKDSQENRDNLISENGWSEYKRYILAALEAVKDDTKEIRKRITLMEIELARIQEKSRNMGAMAGALSGIVCAVASYFIIKGFGG